MTLIQRRNHRPPHMRYTADSKPEPASAALSSSSTASNRRNFIRISGAAMILPWADAKPVVVKPAVSIPGSDSYQQACQIFNSRLTPLPAAVKKCLTEDEIRTGISWARGHQKTISIKSGGHCFEGYCMADGTLSLDLSGMNKMSMDSKSQVLTVEPGAKLRQINEFLLAKGRVLPAGSCAGVGIGGLTLGGGYGLLARQFGLTCDQLIGLHLIDAEGNLHDCQANHELMKACRGGGNGNFGVVTQFRFRTQKAPENLYHRRFKATGLTPQKLRVLLSTWFSASINLPHDAFSAFVLNGKSLTILLTHTDIKSRSRIQQMISPLEPLVDSTTRYFAPLYANAIKTYYGRSGPLPFKNACAGMLKGFAEIDPVVEELAVKVAATSGVIWQANTLGGAIGNPEFAAVSAFAHRDCPYMTEIQGYWDQPSRAERVVRAVDEIQAMFATHGIKRHYCNYPDRNFASPQTSYFGDLTYLQDIKSKYDPNDIFHHPQGIRLPSHR